MANQLEKGQICVFLASKRPILATLSLATATLRIWEALMQLSNLCQLSLRVEFVHHSLEDDLAP